VDPQQVLHVQLDRGQRVLDLVGDSPGHLGPGFQPVGAQEPGDVFEDHDRAPWPLVPVAAQGGEDEVQPPLFILGVPGGRDADLLFAYGLARLLIGISRLAEIPFDGVEKEVQLRPPGEQVGDPPAQGAVGLVQTQQPQTGRVDGGDPALLVE